MGRAIYQDIYHDLREAIVSGDIRPSAFLPSEAELVARYSCSRMTIRKAVSLLANEGVVQPIRGRGVRVISHPSDAINKEDAFRVNGLSSFTESARVIGAKPASKLFLLDSVTCDEKTAGRSGFSEGEELTRVGLVRSLDGHIMAIDRHLFPTVRIPGIDEAIATSSLFRYIAAELKITISLRNREITVEKPSPEDSKLMGLDKPMYLAVIRSHTFDSNGTQFEYVESKYLPSCFHFFDSATRTPLP